MGEKISRRGLLIDASSLAGGAIAGSILLGVGRGVCHEVEGDKKRNEPLDLGLVRENHQRTYQVMEEFLDPSTNSKLLRDVLDAIRDPRKAKGFF